MKELYTESLIALQREKYKRVQALNVASIVFFISAIASVITSYIKSMESVWIGLFAVTMIAAVVLLWSMSARMVYAKVVLDDFLPENVRVDERNKIELYFDNRKQPSIIYDIENKGYIVKDNYGFQFIKICNQLVATHGVIKSMKILSTNTLNYHIARLNTSEIIPNDSTLSLTFHLNCKQYHYTVDESQNIVETVTVSL